LRWRLAVFADKTTHRFRYLWRCVGGWRFSRTRPRVGPSHCARVMWAAGGRVWWAPWGLRRALYSEGATRASGDSAAARNCSAFYPLGVRPADCWRCCLWSPGFWAPHRVVAV